MNKKLVVCLCAGWLASSEHRQQPDMHSYVGMLDMSSDHKRCIKSRHHMYSQIIASSIPQVFSSLDSKFPLPQHWMTDTANTSQIRNHGAAVRKYRTPLCHIQLLNLDILQGSFRLCNWLSLWCLVSWITHLPPACWSTFWKSIFKQQFGCRFDIMDSISLFFCILTYAIIYVLIHHIHHIYIYILHRRNPCTFY